jgi:hypothetical protein
MQKRYDGLLPGSRYRLCRTLDGPVLTPVRIQRGDAVRAKLAELDRREQDIADAVAWARQVPAPLFPDLPVSEQTPTRRSR